MIDRDDRGRRIFQILSGIVGILALGVPVLMLLGSGLACVWAWMFGVPHVGHKFFGWLSSNWGGNTPKTENVGPARWLIIYWIAVGNAALLYLIGEAVHSCVGAFRRIGKRAAW